MKTRRAYPIKRGFTLIELLVAMAITTIIVTVLVSITAIAIDTWNRSRSELRAARQAKTMVDSMVRDFEALVVRKGNDNEWLSAVSKTPNQVSTNAANLVFFSAATDRYNGNIGSSTDNGGDVSCVSYRLDYKDPIGGAGSSFETFVLKRVLVNPDETFRDLLGKTDLLSAFSSYESRLDQAGNFLCENVFQFTVTFHVEVPPATTGTGAGTAKPTNELVTIMPSGGTTKFSIKGTGLTTTPVNDQLKSGRISAVGISLTVLSDSGVDLLRKAPTKAGDAAWLAKNSFQYSKLIQLPGM